MNRKSDYASNWHWIPQAPSSYEIHVTCQIENIGWLLEQLPRPFGAFGGSYKGRVVEVGAFDGVTYSNTWGLICSGWEAILIEPMPENLAKCRDEHKDRPWVKIEACGCGEAESSIQMFFEREGSRVAKPKEPSVTVPIRTLDSILEQHQWAPDFDVLVIDTEDFELEVLRGFDLARWLPKLAIVETHQPYRPIIHQVFAPLYRVYFEDGLNTIFVRQDWST